MAFVEDMIKYTNLHRFDRNGLADRLLWTYHNRELGSVKRSNRGVTGPSQQPFRDWKRLIDLTHSIISYRRKGGESYLKS